MTKCDVCASVIGGNKYKVKYKSENKIKYRTVYMCTCCDAWGCDVSKAMDIDEEDILNVQVKDRW